MSSIVNRKKGGTETEPLTTDPEAATTTPTETSSSTDDAQSKEREDRQIKVLSIIALILTLMIVFSPAHIKKRRRERYNKRFEKVIKTVETHRNSLTEKYNVLTGKINKEKIQYEEDVAKMKTLHQGELTKKQTEINRINEEMKRNKEELEKVKIEMKKMKDESSDFCSECKMITGGGFICGVRVTYLVNNYGDAEDDAKEGLMKSNPECRKEGSSNKVRKEVVVAEQVKVKEDNVVSSFCSECTMTNMGFSCGARAAYFVTTYGDSEDKAKNALMKSNPECKKS